MKNFKNYITEEKKKYTREEMELWCYKNIKDYNTGDNIIINENTQTIISERTDRFEIISQETILPPFSFHANKNHNRFGLICPNLKTLKIDQFINLSSKGDIIFSGTDNLEYDDIDFAQKTFIIFVNCVNVSPKIFSKNKISEVIFSCQNNPMITDFNYYDNSKIVMLYIYPYLKLKNTSNIFTVGNEIGDILFERSYNSILKNTVYSHAETINLNKIFMTYVKDISTNRHEHVMDFTLAMYDAGFEDEV